MRSFMHLFDFVDLAESCLKIKGEQKCMKDLFVVFLQCPTQLFSTVVCKNKTLHPHVRAVTK